MAITTHLLVGNDEATVGRTIRSLLPLECRFVVGDLGSTDGTLDIVRELGCPVVSGPRDRSELRNEMAAASETEWQLFLDPGEELTTGHELVLGALRGDAPYRLYVMRGDVVCKEVRMWRKGFAKFEGPAFECLQPDDAARPLNAFVEGTTSPSQLSELEEWRRRCPHLPEVDYYLALQKLVLGDWEGFLASADYFLFRETRPTMAAVMTRYYSGLTHLRHRRDTQEAARSLTYCVAHRPLMAEFWCALGDCLYLGGDPERAMELYRNAEEMGRLRPTDDAWPIELRKYGEYPRRMSGQCRDALRR